MADGILINRLWHYRHDTGTGTRVTYVDATGAHPRCMSASLNWPLTEEEAVATIMQRRRAIARDHRAAVLTDA